MKKLFLASQSVSRQYLLKEAKIPFDLLQQQADETVCDWSLPLEQVVLSIALHKMKHVLLPDANEGDEILVLTGDTLSQNSNGEIEGKPIDKQDAIRKIKNAREGTRLCTAFCLDLKRFENGTWQTVERIHKAVGASYRFYVPDEWIERYIEHSLSLSCSNAIAVESYGSQFLKEVTGSYTAIVGLPMFEVREALNSLGFWE